MLTTDQGVALPTLEIMFVKPALFMNISGSAIVSASRSFLPSPTSIASSSNYRIITIQDDLDLPPLTYKIQRGGSPRGHNGIRSLSKSLHGARDFYRIRIGVGRPEDKRDAISDWVMGALRRDEVRACERNEQGGGGSLLMGCWGEIMRITGDADATDC